MAIVVTLTVLVGVIVAYTWVATQSFNFVHGGLGGSNLQPVKIVGPEEMVFNWRRDACEPRDIPDAPARAFRDATGTVHLIGSHYVNRQMTGADLGRLRHDCALIMRSTYSARPDRFADKEWIAAPYTLDGNTIFALIHNEYQGDTHAGRCGSGLVLRCWYNAVTLVRSDDRGRTFRHARPAPGHLVAEVPYRYTPDAGHYGIFQPSNIVAHDGYYYVLAYADPYRQQQGGTCVLRTQHLDDPASWRAWSGTGYTVPFVDPYAPRVDTGAHICEPVDPDAIGRMTNSLTYNTYFGKFLLVGESGDYSPTKRGNVYGFYYAVSDDLIHWSKRKLLRETELVSSYQCGDRDPVAYPSLLDPSSNSRNFETTGRRPYLYFTRMHYEACQQTLNRDLVRVPVEFSK